MSAAVLCIGRVEADVVGAPFIAEVPGTTSADLFVFVLFCAAWRRLMEAHFHVEHCDCGRLVLS